MSLAHAWYLWVSQVRIFAHSKEYCSIPQEHPPIEKLQGVKRKHRFHIHKLTDTYAHMHLCKCLCVPQADCTAAEIKG